jgi:hypothetical protein
VAATCTPNAKGEVSSIDTFFDFGCPAFQGLYFVFQLLGFCRQPIYRGDERSEIEDIVFGKLPSLQANWY